MSFGEHLEELRGALAKALLWLLVGLCVGLPFAANVVQYVQTPLEAAIRTFYAEKTLSELGIDPSDASEEKALLIKQGLTLETVYVLPLSHGSLELDKQAVNSQKQAVAKEPVVEAAQVAIAADDLMHLRPLQIFRPVKASLSNLRMEEPFMIWMKAGLMLGAMLASPMIFWHIWAFIAAGLYSHERRYVYTYLPLSLLLFWGGVLLAFYGVLALVLNFFLTFNAAMNVDPTPRLSDYVSFVLIMPLGFGIAFQLPLVMLLLERIGIFQRADYLNSWRVAMLVIAVVSMVLTPSDVFSMLAMAIPLSGLYFLGIALCKYMPRGPGIGTTDLVEPA